MRRLSININKVATLRNSRGENTPDLIKVVEDLISWGVQGITIHPRPDGRHILYSDVREISRVLKLEQTILQNISTTKNQNYPSQNGEVELNIEGYPSSKFLNLIEEIRPHQCTLVPDEPHVLTSHEGWDTKKNFSLLQEVLNFLHSQDVRTSLFIDPLKWSSEQLDDLEKLKPHRVEFYTGKWAQNFQTPEGKKILQIYKELSEKIKDLQIDINAGHDLNQDNLKQLIQEVPLIQEVSIGHAFICESLYSGFEKTLNCYFSILDSLP